MIRVMLVGLPPALRAGIQTLLAPEDRFRFVSEPADWGDSFQIKNEAEVVIATSASFDALLDEVDPSSPGAGWAILLLSDNPADVPKLNRAVQAWGILPEDTSAEELQAAVVGVSTGLIVGGSHLLFASDQELGLQSPLTGREQEVLALLARGLANKQIAASLGISEHTVKFHVSSIFSKLNVTNRTEAVRAGLRGGWIAL